MINWLEALILGLVQGATEYLPVSSSGHLVIFQHLFGLTEPALLFDIVLHLATLVVVLGYYRRDIVELLQQSGRAVVDLGRGDRWSLVQKRYPGFRLAWLIVVGTVPTALLGITLEESFEALFGSLRIVGLMLCVTGLILVSTRWAGRGQRDLTGVRLRDALLIGLVQGLAITPGISRSGSTISVALLAGIERETAARYSFLLSVPSILGALLLKLGDAADSVGLSAMALGFAAALVSGHLCLVFLVRIVKRGRLAWFAPYCFVVGLLAILLAALQGSS